MKLKISIHFCNYEIKEDLFLFVIKSEIKTLNLILDGGLGGGGGGGGGGCKNYPPRKNIVFF